MSHPVQASGARQSSRDAPPCERRSQALAVAIGILHLRVDRRRVCPSAARRRRRRCCCCCVVVDGCARVATANCAACVQSALNFRPISYWFPFHLTDSSVRSVAQHSARCSTGVCSVWAYMCVRVCALRGTARRALPRCRVIIVLVIPSLPLRARRTMHTHTLTCPPTHMNVYVYVCVCEACTGVQQRVCVCVIAMLPCHPM
jgi:hypothetical protein